MPSVYEEDLPQAGIISGQQQRADRAFDLGVCRSAHFPGSNKIDLRSENDWLFSDMVAACAPT
jgi:hypothetical protein